MRLYKIFIATVAFLSQSNSIFGALIRRNSQHSDSVEDEVASIEHRKLQSLACNDGVVWSCVPWSFGLNPADVEIPCGACYNMDIFLNNEVITMSGALNIKGRLEFNDGTKVTLKTTGVIVEGELAMTSTKPVDGTPDIVIELTGTSPVLYPPHPDNVSLCPDVVGNNCRVKAKSFLVLGKLDINGLNDNCPTWSTIDSFIGSGAVMPSVFSKRPILPISRKGTCSYDFLNEAFESGPNGWYGNIGAEENILSGSDDGSNYLHVTNRTATFQGPMLEINRYIRECVIPDTDYFFTAKVRLSAGPEAAQDAISACSTSKVNCPQLRMSHMNFQDRVKWRTLAETKTQDFSDGQWISIKSNFKITATQLNASDVFTFIILNGPEAGIDISIDDIAISLPPADAYPDPTNVCGDLVQNGDASVLDGFAFPMRGYLYRNPVFVKDDGSGNQYFSITNREYAHDNLVFDIEPECLEANSVYTFSMKIRIHSVDEVIPEVILKFHATTLGDKPLFEFVARDCPATSIDIGWTTCTSDITFKAGHSSAPRVETLILIQEDLTSDVDVDDISFTHKSGAPSALRLHDVSQLEDCWSAGAQIALPSETLDYEQGHSATIEAIVDGNGVDLIETITPSPTSRVLNKDFAVEMALLSRNILFKNGDSSSVGPSLTVYKTSTPQKIQGVEFDGFGEEGVFGINPIYFKECGNSKGSVISKNSIRNSNNRCIHIDQTSGVNIKENVAHETKGHCYSLSNGEGEFDNVFEKNIGFVTRNAVSVAAGQTDNNAATFYITNPSNSWIDNCAAGSNYYGFWFALPPSTMNYPVTAFSGNVIHSSFMIGLKTFPQGLTPIIPSTWYNSRIYRNRGHGIFFHNTRDITLDGFTFADNKISIDLYMAEKIFIKNTVIRGYTEAFETTVKASPGNSMKHCWPKPNPDNFRPIMGIRMHSNAKTVGYGTNVVQNVTFTDFNPDTGCNTLSAAIKTNPDKRGDSYTGLLAVADLTFEAGTEPVNMISLCDAQDGGITDISIPDSTGSMNPTGTTPGFIVSDVGNTGCITMDNTCARYCPDADASTGVQDALAGNIGGSGGGTSPGICITNKWNYFRSSELQSVSGPDGAVALVAGSRVHQQLGGFKQDFATACLTETRYYEVTADVKLTQSGTDDIFLCNPATQWNNDPESCAGFVLLKNPLVPLTEIGGTVGPLSGTGWNKMYGLFEATDAMKENSILSIFIARAPITADITISNVVFNEATSPPVQSCIKNGDAETGDHRFWMIRGQGPGKGTISIVDGYNSASAFRHTGKTLRSRGLLQYLDPKICFEDGVKMQITAKFRYFDTAGNPVLCKKVAALDAKDACPVFELANDGIYLGSMINENKDTMVVGDWNDIKHTFTVTQPLADAKTVWLFVNQVAANAIYDLDDISITTFVS